MGVQHNAPRQAAVRHGRPDVNMNLNSGRRTALHRE